MNRSDWIEAIAMIVASFFAIGLLKIPAYIIVVILVASFYVLLYQRTHEVVSISKKRNRQLENTIKMKNTDAYLKQKQLITLISNLPVPLVLLDEDGKVVLYNSYFELFRKSSDEMELSYKDNDFTEDVSKFVNDSYIFEREMDKNMNIHGIEYQAIAVPITTNKRFSGCVILFQDISKAKEKEDMQKQFIADASHELKTPISAIKGMVEIINRDNFDDAETEKEFLTQIEKETNRLDEIVSDLLRLSKLSTDIVVLRRSMLDLTTLIDDSVVSLQMKAKEKGIAIQKEYQTQEPVFVDADKMEIVINNLLSNAIKYSDSGVITLSTKMDEDVYIFEIRDQGKGLRRRDIDKIFERFYRVDSARHRSSGGSGLGLSIVKSIVDAHNATITVESKVGEGTMFRIAIK